MIIRTILIMMMSLSSCATAQEVKIKRIQDIEKNVYLTAYTHTESDHIKWGRKTATGSTLKPGIAASDWSKFPVDTEFIYNGKKYIVEDYGSALVKSKKDIIDIYKPSKKAMRSHPTDYYTIQIVKWGCFEKSLRILKGRLHSHHCKVMYNRIWKKIQQSES